MIDELFSDSYCALIDFSLSYSCMRFDYSKGLGLLFSAFVFSALVHSLFGYINIIDEIKNEQDRLDRSKAELYFLSKNVEKFIGPEIDYDLLETQARNILAIANTNEVVIFWKDVPGEDLNVYYG